MLIVFLFCILLYIIYTLAIDILWPLCRFLLSPAVLLWTTIHLPLSHRKTCMLNRPTQSWYNVCASQLQCYEQRGKLCVSCQKAYSTHFLWDPVLQNSSLHSSCCSRWSSFHLFFERDFLTSSYLGTVSLHAASPFKGIFNRFLLNFKTNRRAPSLSPLFLALKTPLLASLQHDLHSKTHTKRGFLSLFPSLSPFVN